MWFHILFAQGDVIVDHNHLIHASEDHTGGMHRKGTVAVGSHMGASVIYVYNYCLPLIG